MKNQQNRWVQIFITLAAVLPALFLQAIELDKGRLELKADRADEKIVVDGELRERVWLNTPMSETFMTYNPVYGQAMKHHTDVWFAYDESAVYFAFKCYDPEPDKIKTSVTHRDNIINDDWVGVIVDSMGTKQSAYEFYVNPSGVQADYLNYGINVEPDPAPDFIWQSASRITNEGFQVEIRIPLSSLRFKSGKDVRMGVLCLRNTTRLGLAGTWPATSPGQTDFNCMATVIYEELKGKRKFEILPNFTLSQDKARTDGGGWGEADSAANIGLSVKYGLSTAASVEATVNPDFSQVESDSFQVEVNRRYPIFYTEKRPFFMEGTDAFDFGTIFQGMMAATVHTRRIIDPDWAGKVSGAVGRSNFTFLAANDRAPGQAWEIGENPDEGKEALWGIGRWKYNFSSDNSLGLLYSGRSFAGSQNHVVGIDARYRFFRDARLSLGYLNSTTSYDGLDETRKGNGVIGMFQYFIPKFTLWSTYEMYDRDFVMDSAFLNRSAMSRFQVLVGPNFEMKVTRKTVIHRIQPFLYYSRLHDYETGMNDVSRGIGSFLWFPQWGILRLTYQDDREAWLGETYKLRYFDAWGNMQVMKQLFVLGSFIYGDLIYYHPSEAQVGTNLYYLISGIFQPNLYINITLEFIHDHLKNKFSNEKFYSVDILNLKTTYQFNRQFFLRASLRYDSFQQKLLTDFLASYELLPGTVMQLGYGSLYEKTEWRQEQWVPGVGKYRNMRNALFFKVSYLWRRK